MSAHLLGIGTAMPPGRVSQEMAAAMAGALFPHDPPTARVIPVLYRRAGVRERASVVVPTGLKDGADRRGFFPPAESAGFRGPKTSARGERYVIEAPALAHGACVAALASAKVDAGRVTHLITVSCTGFSAPGVDAALIESLGLSRGVQRTHIGFMGCHGAINALRVARAFSVADPAAVVLVAAVELCSLHFHYTSEPDKMVANALFADGAAAAVIAGGAGGRSDALVISACGSCLLPKSQDAMTWNIGDHGFEMTLSSEVPVLLEKHLRRWVCEWLGAQGLRISEVGSWAVHPGGPRVLSTVASSLGLDESAVDVSRAVLADHGNMSSPTVLFIVDRLVRAGAKRPIVALAFGPGLTAEGAVIL